MLFSKEEEKKKKEKMRCAGKPLIRCIGWFVELESGYG